MKQYIKTYFCCRLGELGVVAALWGAGLPCLSSLGKAGVLFPAYPTGGKLCKSPGGFSGVAEKGACEPGAATAMLSPGGRGEGKAEETGTDTEKTKVRKRAR